MLGAFSFSELYKWSKAWNYWFEVHNVLPINPTQIYKENKTRLKVRWQETKVASKYGLPLQRGFGHCLKNMGMAIQEDLVYRAEDLYITLNWLCGSKKKIYRRWCFRMFDHFNQRTILKGFFSGGRMKWFIFLYRAVNNSIANEYLDAAAETNKMKKNNIIYFNHTFNWDVQKISIKKGCDKFIYFYILRRLWKWRETNRE
jgi:hypothetical protein